MKLIDADKITEETLDQYTWLDREQMKSVLDCIADQPTVDAVPVFRCENCRYAEIEHGRIFCKSDEFFHDFGYDDYCEVGEPKEGEQ